MMSRPAWPKNLRAKHVRQQHASFVEQVEVAAAANQTRPLTLDAVVTLREVTEDSARAIIFLDVLPH